MTVNQLSLQHRSRVAYSFESLDRDGNDTVGIPVIDPLIPQYVHQLPDDRIIGSSKSPTMTKGFLGVIGIKDTTSDSTDVNSYELQELDFRGSFLR